MNLRFASNVESASLNKIETMKLPDFSSGSSSVTRREFIKNSSLMAASTAAALSFPAVVRAQAKPPMNAVIIGVGGRGSGAGENFLEAAKSAGVEGKIVAIADLFPEQALRANKALGVAEEKCLSG